MSENSPAPSPRRPDRRVARTRDRLGDAMIELLLAKPFEEITVEEVLTLAGVSRSTFYAHYRDKNDLFLSDVDDFFAGMSTLLASRDDPSARVAPVAELFSHVAGARGLYQVMVESGRLHEITQLGEAHFARSIAERLARGRRAGTVPKKQRAALAHALAGALFALLTAWIRQSAPASPQEMDALFHSLVPADLMPAARPAATATRRP